MDTTNLSVAEWILESIEKEWEKPKCIRSQFKLYVWFDPKQGDFLYDDTFFGFKIFQILIHQQKLTFDRFSVHQGEEMIRYKLR
jgi:hypothetical protein